MSEETCQRCGVILLQNIDALREENARLQKEVEYERLKRARMLDGTELAALKKSIAEAPVMYGFPNVKWHYIKIKNSTHTCRAVDIKEIEK